MRNKLSALFVGLCFIALGAAFIGNVFDWWDFNLFFSGWWTLFIIIPCICSMISSGINVGNLIGVGVGVILFLGAQDILTYSTGFKVIIPVAFVLIGISIIYRSIFKKPVAHPQVMPNGKIPSYDAVFGGSKPNFDNQVFYGCEATGVFGGVDLNLRAAKIESDCEITCNAIFGGVDIFPPSNVKIRLTSTPIFGGVSNKFYSPADDSAPTLYINATCIFGGIDIK